MRFKRKVKHHSIPEKVSESYAVVYICNIEGFIIIIMSQLQGQGKVTNQDIVGQMHSQAIEVHIGQIPAFVRVLEVFQGRIIKHVQAYSCFCHVGILSFVIDIQGGDIVIVVLEPAVVLKTVGPYEREVVFIIYGGF